MTRRRRREEADFNFWPTFVDITFTIILFLFFYILVDFFANSELFILMDMKNRQSAVHQAFEGKFAKEFEQKIIRIHPEGDIQRLYFSDRFLFDSGSFRLKETGKQLLGEVFDIIFKHHKEFLRVEVVGHTDNVPLKSTAQDNWSLSANRAVAVVRFAISRGFTTSIISATGYGEYRPIASNETAEGKQLNRRIEILLVYSRSDKFILSLFKKKVKDQIIVPSETKPVVPTPDGKIHTK